MKIQEIVRKYITMQAFFWKGLDLPVDSKRDHEYFGNDETQYGLTQCKKAIFCLVCFVRKSFLVIQSDWTNKITFVQSLIVTKSSSIEKRIKRFFSVPISDMVVTLKKVPR